MHTLATFPRLDDAHALRLALESQDIQAVVLGEHSVGFIGGGVAVAVLHEADLPSARTILQEFSGSRTLRLVGRSSTAEPGDTAPERLTRPWTMVTALWLVAASLALDIVHLAVWRRPESLAVDIAGYLFVIGLCLAAARRSRMARWVLISLYPLGVVLSLPNIRWALAGSPIEGVTFAVVSLLQAAAWILLLLPASSAWYRVYHPETG